MGNYTMLYKIFITEYMYTPAAIYIMYKYAQVNTNKLQKRSVPPNIHRNVPQFFASLMTKESATNEKHNITENTRTVSWYVLFSHKV